MTDQKLLFENLVSELRRGSLILSVLALLRQPQYGYSLISGLEAFGIAIEAGTLYPLLRRLEKQGLLSSEWAIDQVRPRRYYVLNELGKQTLTHLSDEWQRMNKAMDQLIQAPSSEQGG
ncbi:MAG: PadR family transcriptional regulator [Eubacteriales bacterium]|nr:PadR family transcriptional regulator [Eubacteriales bacterium]